MSQKNPTINILPLAARTAAPAAFRMQANEHEACVLVIDVTAIAAAPSLTVTVRGVDKLSGKRWTILASAALVGAGTTILKIGAGLPAAANASANDLLPPDFEVLFAHGNGDSITYSVALHLMRGY